MDIFARIIEQARRRRKNIVLPEGDDARVLQAALRAQAAGIARIVLLGDAEKIRQHAGRMDSGCAIKAIEIIDRNDFAAHSELAGALMEAGKPGQTISAAQVRERLRRPLCFAALLVKTGRAHGVVAGAVHTTAEVLSTALKILGVRAGMKTVSSAFIMQLPQSPGHGDAAHPAGRVFLFADCAVVPEPTPEQLSDIALSTADTAESLLGLAPRVAMLSFSTHRSAKHESAERVRTATRLAAARRPGLVIDGELQADAALVPEVAKLKAPGGSLQGAANVLVFPDLQSGNIGYKLVQRMAGAQAVGPVLQGLGAPWNDLSRGCSSEDILNMIAITAVQAQYA